jgi:hypothetical protein
MIIYLICNNKLIKLCKMLKYKWDQINLNFLNKKIRGYSWKRK